MFRRVLVANRGEVACRVIRTLHELGVEAVAVYSDADRGAAHVHMADHAVRLGRPPPEESYLDGERILAAAQAHEAEAVHPGYGFLSERPDFAAAVEAAGLTFVGPRPDQIRDFGEKHVARRLAARASVPLLPGSDILGDLDEALAAADRVGYPVMLKAVAGGGGIGMQVCADAGELGAAFGVVGRLGAANFGSAAVFLERFLPSARHVEVQIFGDGEGRVLTVGTRDCSLQRRNQKVIEEAPAPGLADAGHEALVADARRFAESVRYRSAGTVEFVVDTTTGRHHFLEVNTRLQVEHAVTELVYGIDLVAWMLRLAAGDRRMFDDEAELPEPSGHAVEARVYAESPLHGFRPSVGRLTRVELPEQVRCDNWVASGTEVTPFYDPLLLKVVAHGGDRPTAISRLDAALSDLRLDGLETNVDHLRAALADAAFTSGRVTTGLLAGLSFAPPVVEVLAGDHGPGDAMVVSYPGRVGYWSVGVPPSGPMDDWSFRLGNRLLGNPDDAAGLEWALAGPHLRFHRPATVCLAGADMGASLHPPGGDDGRPVPCWQAVQVPAGATLRLGSVADVGVRGYLLVRGGVEVPEVLGSRTTFTLGGFGGHAGRALTPGDLVRLGPEPTDPPAVGRLPEALAPRLSRHWRLAVLEGPHAAPDYLTPEDVDLLYDADWVVHYHLDRTGIRLVGPRLRWARPDGGDAGLHPSNLHDNPYAVGAVNFTGDMPVILGPDGPSLGGFVCPATVIDADLWKLGQLQPGDKVRLVPVTTGAAAGARRAQQAALAGLGRPGGPGGPCGDSDGSQPPGPAAAGELSPAPLRPRAGRADVVLAHTPRRTGRPELTFRRSGDRHLLIEVGPPVLDLDLRVRVQQLADWFVDEQVAGVCDLTPGIRSLQVQVDGERLTVERAIVLARGADEELPPPADVVLPSRIVRLPMSWDDPTAEEAIHAYQRSVRADAPWCPSNLEFVRRINGLDSIDDVRRVAFEAEYVVYGLGDVYLGAPAATPLDPRHRLVTTKYNPARTWTPENAVGMGGAYLCIYGMESPGGYQLVGRTTQIWQRWPSGPWERSWLLRYFDRIRFYPVDAEELADLRAECAAGRWHPVIEQGELSIAEHHRFLESISSSADRFRLRQRAAFAAERTAWEASGELAAADAAEQQLLAAPEAVDEIVVPDGARAIVAPLTALVWSVAVDEGDLVEAGDLLLVLEAMKTETPVRAPHAGVVLQVACAPEDVVTAGQILAVVGLE